MSLTPPEPKLAIVDGANAVARGVVSGVLRLPPNPGQVVGWSGCQCELAAFVL